MYDLFERESTEPTTFDLLGILFPRGSGKVYSTKSEDSLHSVACNATVFADAPHGSYLILTTHGLEKMVSADTYACDLWKVTPEGQVQRTEYVHYNNHGKGAPSFNEVIGGLTSRRGEGFATYRPTKPTEAIAGTRKVLRLLEVPAGEAGKTTGPLDQVIPKPSLEKILIEILEHTEEWRRTENKRALMHTAAQQKSATKEFMDRHL